ncbi:MAG: hypothetical protein KDA25_03935 [Phycisphaerales bacterium]|nr:hypothetical protein [Phycisphaerales bacterium]
MRTPEQYPTESLPASFEAELVAIDAMLASEAASYVPPAALLDRILAETRPLLPAKPAWTPRLVGEPAVPGRRVRRAWFSRGAMAASVALAFVAVLPLTLDRSHIAGVDVDRNVISMVLAHDARAEVDVTGLLWEARFGDDRGSFVPGAASGLGGGSRGASVAYVDEISNLSSDDLFSVFEGVDEGTGL